MTAPVPPALATAPTGAVGTGRLALIFQEALTAITRLRGERQPVSADVFRAQMLQLLTRADQEARASGYDPNDVRLATFAVVALLDESALNSRQPGFGDWARRPLQEELFGGHMAGEWFFQHAEQLLARPDAPALADLLEIHQLCLLLGFRGRYSAADPGALHALTARLADRIGRMRGGRAPFAPDWRPPADAVVRRDPWIRPLTITLAASVVLALALWGAGAVSVRGTVGDLAPLAAGASPSAAR